MRRAPLATAILLAILAPQALAQPPGGAIDATITLAPGSSPTVDAPAGMVRLNASEGGKEYLFDLRLDRDYTTLEIRADGFRLERARQLVPSLVVNQSEYPLFHDFPNERIWDVDGSANVFHANGTGDAIVLRLGIAGPRNVTLALTVDATPPEYTLGERQNMTHIGFYQETTTNELTLADLQVRRVGTEEWIQNPTPSYHVLQKFPVQGLDARTEYETRVVFVDWAGNLASTPITTFTTPAAPVVPIPAVRIVSPPANATLPAGAITIRAAVESNESPVRPDGVRLFFDLTEVSDDVDFDGNEVTYTPRTALLPGMHRVSVEATNELGGTGTARWSFHIGGGPESDTPFLSPFAAILALALAHALARRRGPPRSSA